MSLNDSPTNPRDNPIVFFTGKDDYLMTRQFGKWLDIGHITLKRKDYQSLLNLTDVCENPWSVEVPLKGTDGF